MILAFFIFQFGFYVVFHLLPAFPLQYLLLFVVVSVTIMWCVIQLVYHTYWYGMWFIISVCQRPWQYHEMQGVWTRQIPRSVDSIIHQIMEFSLFLYQVRMPAPPVEVDDLPPQVRRFPGRGRLAHEIAYNMQQSRLARKLGHFRTAQQERRYKQLEELVTQVQVYDDTDPIPQRFVCPISYLPMTDAVVTSSGISYQRDPLKKWIVQKGTCPMSNKCIDGEPLYSNLGKNNELEEWAQDVIRKRKSPEGVQNRSSERLKAQRIDKD